MTLCISTVNVNGIRAATKKRNENNLGMNSWVLENQPDIVLLQEVRASVDQAEKALAPTLEAGWHLYCAPSVQKGRAGVAILSRQPLADVQIGFGSFKEEGRWISGTYAADFGDLRIASLYLPSGDAATAKQDEKYRFLDEFTPVLAQWAKDYPQAVIGGDWNICHRQQDLKNWKGNLKSSGFLADERRFMDSVFGSFPDDASQVTAGPSETEAGNWFGAVDYPGGPVREPAAAPQWFDVVRRFHPTEAGPYSWWTYRGQAFNNDAGWRIDYQAVTKAMLERAEKTWVDKASSVDMRWSDHAPVNVIYK
ncbi:exodeoxyribonuclease III [Corynebacterium caspium]|uniref:exodeoxyribonuclease III n=1 Tax=Corynebacterium caspium TaxID=234828 RepID=UPI00037565D8|nr:exodeoxyribonuclease III [Corynebacterium caspium]WKD59762.1 Exodeoxyribonuclease [Corynebacterium caspium DSM 44850]